jgi:hypothetical protein
MFVPHLTDQFKVEFRQSPPPSEVRSRARSILILLGQLMDAGPGRSRTRLGPVDIEHRLAVVPGLKQEMLHPQEQVRGYVELASSAAVQLPKADLALSVGSAAWIALAYISPASVSALSREDYCP